MLHTPSRLPLSTSSRTCLAALILTVSMGSSRADEWTGPDKERHALAGALVGAGATLVFKNELHGVLAAAAVGAGKELWDATSKRGHPSFKDFAVTALGGVIGARVSGLLVLPARDGLYVSYRQAF